jgi:hypothetical protein
VILAAENHNGYNEVVRRGAGRGIDHFRNSILAKVLCGHAARKINLHLGGTRKLINLTLEEAAASEKSASQLRDALYNGIFCSLRAYAIDKNRRRRNVSSDVSSSSASLLYIRAIMTSNELLFYVMLVVVRDSCTKIHFAFINANRKREIKLQNTTLTNVYCLHRHQQCEFFSNPDNHEVKKQKFF